MMTIKQESESKKKVYVTMTDKFMSGWGLAKNKLNKFVITCDNYEQAKIVYNNAKKREEMKFVNIVYNKPYYNEKFYKVSSRIFSDLGEIWTKETD